MMTALNRDRALVWSWIIAIVIVTTTGLAMPEWVAIRFSEAGRATGQMPLSMYLGLQLLLMGTAAAGALLLAPRWSEALVRAATGRSSASEPEKRRAVNHAHEVASLVIWYYAAKHTLVAMANRGESRHMDTQLEGALLVCFIVVTTAWAAWRYWDWRQSADGPRAEP